MGGGGSQYYANANQGGRMRLKITYDAVRTPSCRSESLAQRGEAAAGSRGFRPVLRQGRRYGRSIRTAAKVMEADTPPTSTSIVMLDMPRQIRA